MDCQLPREPQAGPPASDRSYYIKLSAIRSSAVAATIDEAFRDADVAITVTTAQQPLMLARHIKPGALTIQLAGHECEFSVIKQCNKIVTDD